MSSKTLVMLTTDVPGRTLLESFVVFKNFEALRSKGFAVHSNARKVKRKQEKNVPSIVAGRNHDFPRTSSHSKQVVHRYKRLF